MNMRQREAFLLLISQMNPEILTREQITTVVFGRKRKLMMERSLVIVSLCLAEKPGPGMESG